MRFHQKAIDMIRIFLRYRRIDHERWRSASRRLRIRGKETPAKRRKIKGAING